ncbi:MAG TPA: amidohydrolase family protein [Saprospiraceae bacterium]|nr:amidohydrolase family protein [Saprospiraceae bacterium]HMQ85659.1 amidohydrolase family protein [Saprospiraceae bacterium]
MSRKTILFLSCCLFSSLLGAQDKKEEKKWDVNNPEGTHQSVELAFQEGTWMNLDVSPDGKTLVFDLLGDIYSLPIAGGEAKLLRQGLAWEVQPRFSPDGKKILFTSDAGGGDNIWIMDQDGQNARQVTKESFRLLNNPAWMPDGQYFVARKHFTSQRSLGAGEIWMYHISGGEGIQLTKRKNDQQDVNEPCVSPDGRYVYFSEDMYPGGFFQYNKDPNSQIYIIKQYDFQKGESSNLIAGAGGACRPQVSNDGKKLAFVRRVREKSVLFLHDLGSGQNFPIFDELSKDQQEAWAIFGVYPGFDWMPDDRHIVLWAQGKIWKIDVQNGQKTEIPFTAKANHRFQETIHFENPAFEEEFQVHVIRHAVTSPDEKTLLFNAAGYLWKMPLPKGKPSRLNNSTDFEFEPAFSQDGKEILFVTWNDVDMGAIWRMNLSTGERRKITSEKAIYRTPQFSPDGKTIVYHKEDGNIHQGYAFCKEPGIYTMPANGGEAKLITPKGEYPVFSADGQRIFFQTGGYLFGSLTKSYYSIKADGSDERKLFDGLNAQQFVPSPDNKWVAWSELYKVYVAPMPLAGQPIGLSATTKAIPVAQVAKDAGINIHWSADSKKLFWTLGNEYFSDVLTERFLFLEGAVDSIPPLDTTGLLIDLKLQSDRPSGVIALTNARIITMEGDEVIENGSIVIEGNVIKALGSSINIPRNAQVIDCSGKTIMPGLIDVHGHLGDFRYGLSPQRNWYYYANLAYGVTTAHDPSSNSEMIFSHSEMIKAGQMVGPRLYSTGTILYGADGDFKAVINSLDDARSAIRRTKAYGAFSVKSYNQPRREQRQQVLQAARELGILVVPEGGSFFYHNMSMVADGHTGIEHNIPVAPLYDDVIQFWAQTKTHNTPTLIVNYGSVNGEYYWYQHTNVWEKERLLRFTPRPLIDARARHRTMLPESEYTNGHILTSQSLNKLQAEGVNINLGAHGQLQGLGAHWELWMLQQGGMSNHQALKCATLNGAIYLGMDQQIGSLKAGKLADLIVLDKNPLEDIRYSEQVCYTMINGRLYDAETMDEIGNHPKKRAPFYFELEGSGNAWPLMTDTQSWMPAQCGCRK